MAFDIDWRLGQPQVNAGNALLQGFEVGRQMRKEADTQSALGAYAQAPSMETANALIAVDPQLGMKARAQQQEMEQTAQLRNVTGAAVRGDPGAMDQLAGIDIDTWSKIDARRREQVKRATGFMGQAVMEVSRQPTEEAKAAMWAQFVQQAEASGMDIPTQYERYSPQALNAAAAEAGTMEKLIKSVEPDWRFSPNGGLVDFNNPESISQYGQWMAKGGPGAVSGPQPGAVEGGYRFRGGDPGDPASWEPVNAGGPTQPASGGFRP